MYRKNITTTLDHKLYKEVQKLAIDLECSANDLMEEGMRKVLLSYDIPLPAHYTNKEEINNGK